MNAATHAAPEIADEAAQVIHACGTLIFPTDTVYGIGADPQCAQAIERIYGAKSRPLSKPLSLHFASVAELLEYLHGNAMATLAARAFLPGPLTIIVARPSFIDKRVTAGLPTLGLRVPDHALCRAILERTGPLAATSANISGEPAYTGSREQALPDADLVIDAGPTPVGHESTVIDLSGAEPRVIREGSLPLERLREALGPIAAPRQAAIVKDHSSA